MKFQFALISVAVSCLLITVDAQRSPYLGSSDPGVLPQYEAPGSAVDRFGEEAEIPLPSKQMHAGTLETEEVYNRVSEWPEQRKPFWYLNAVALQAQREQQQQQQRAQQAAAAQAQNRPSPFAAGSRRGGSSTKRQES